jgi:hypothetical protein
MAIDVIFVTKRIGSLPMSSLPDGASMPPGSSMLLAPKKTTRHAAVTPSMQDTKPASADRKLR